MGRKKDKKLLKLQRENRKLEQKFEELTLQIPTAQGMLMEGVLSYIEKFEQDNIPERGYGQQGYTPDYKPRYLESLKKFCNNYIPK